MSNCILQCVVCLQEFYQYKYSSKRATISNDMYLTFIRGSPFCDLVQPIVAPTFIQNLQNKGNKGIKRVIKDNFLSQ
jgi:hypothetical protein